MTASVRRSCFYFAASWSLLLCLTAIVRAETDYLAVRETATDVQSRLFAGQFEELDDLVEQWRRDRVRTANGDWKLSIFYDQPYELERYALRSNFPNGDSWQWAETWINKRPSSPTPHIFKAILLVAQSQKSDPWDEEKKAIGAPQRPVIDFLSEAKLLLEQTKVISAADPQWYVTMIKVLALQGAQDADIFLVHEEGLRKFPSYTRISEELLDAMSRRWAGKTQLLEGVANTVSALTDPAQGQIAYARLFDRWAHGVELEKLQPLSAFSWEKAKSGFGRIAAEYPSQWNEQQIAFYACLALDKDTARRWFPKSDRLAIHDVWRSPMVYRQCHGWLSDGNVKQ